MPTSTREELLAQLLVLEETEHPDNRLRLHGEINEMRRKRDHAKALAAHPKLHLNSPDAKGSLRVYIDHLREPLIQADADSGTGAMDDCLVSVITACDEQNPTWENVLCALRRVFRKAFAWNPHLGPVEGVEVAQKNAAAKLAAEQAAAAAANPTGPVGYEPLTPERVAEETAARMDNIKKAKG